MLEENNNIVDLIKGMTVIQIKAQLEQLEKFHSGTVFNNFKTLVYSIIEEGSDKYDVSLLSTGENKIAVIKIIRQVTHLGLKAAKELTDFPGYNNVVMSNCSEHIASGLISALTAVGAIAKMNSTEGS